MNVPPEAYDAIIIGAGAAGLMCAIEAGRRGRRVLVVEHNDAVGKKIRISGGGRCNFTNLHTEQKRFISNNPRFCYSALSRYTPAHFVSFVERHGIAYHEKKLGQLFCDGSAQQIIDALLADCAEAGVTIRVGCSVAGVEKNDGFVVATSQGKFAAAALVIATGGLSIPKLGATDFGYRIAKQFGVPVVQRRPGLVPLTLAKAELAQLADLSGISFNAVVSFGNDAFEENVLVTHRGLSGPAILQISSYWEFGKDIAIDLFPGEDLCAELLHMKRDAPQTSLKSFLDTRFSARFAQRLIEMHGWTRPLGEISDASVRAIAESLRRWKITPAGTEGYAKAEVTCGGVDTNALSPKTMESRDVPGLYFIGEVMDVTGWLGGYNFQWAWSSSVAAGRSV
ncbi:MAG: NAD(P)/FAD-dependent oxidoreductase [Candidatus Hydrogenedentes bacterium]|nr:NAD(P)/FAD-dependent oxidoreductase [Candidatus Hydrogenedentota bacterium]